jgi:oxepin-CoA hydrolase/3-oxo-5,6-dehydrosuberyl-CoA semialdehyde dehydrogenase
MFIGRSSLRRSAHGNREPCPRVASKNGACVSAYPRKVDLDRNIKPENPFPRKPQFGVATAEQVHVSAHRDRIVTAIIDRDCAKEQTGHGSPMPQMVHGGPGRAGGGEELGGMRSLHHYMQRTALQGSPAMLTNVTASWIKGAPVVEKEQHPFRHHFEDLDIGQTFFSRERKITLEDIEHFAHFTGDTFYAHMSEEATKGHPFFPGRVAHGYLLLSFAAGLFVDPDPGPVLANYGLDTLRFVKPLQPGETIKVRLTAKDKSPRNKQYGEVRWDVEIMTDKGETAATYELLTMNAVRA